MITYQEIKPGMIEIMKLKSTFAQSEIQDGDVVCFQVDINEKEYGARLIFDFFIFTEYILAELMT